MNIEKLKQAFYRKLDEAKKNNEKLLSNTDTKAVYSKIMAYPSMWFDWFGSSTGSSFDTEVNNLLQLQSLLINALVDDGCMTVKYVKLVLVEPENINNFDSKYVECSKDDPELDHAEFHIGTDDDRNATPEECLEAIRLSLEAKARDKAANDAFDREMGLTG